MRSQSYWKLFYGLGRDGESLLPSGGPIGRLPVDSNEKLWKTSVLPDGAVKLRQPIYWPTGKTA